MLVKARVALDVPTAVVVEHAPVLETAVLTPLISFEFEPQQYSPQTFIRSTVHS